MIQTVKVSRWHAGIGLHLAIAAASCLLAARAEAQQDAPKKIVPPQAEKPRYDYHLFHLKMTRAADIARVLSQVFGEKPAADMRIVSDDATNTVLVAGAPDDLKTVEVLIQKLEDTLLAQGDSQAVTRFHIIPLKHTRVDEKLEKTLKLILSGPNIRFALDPQRNQVVVVANEATIQKVQQLLRGLDEPPTISGPARLQVRVVWLATGHPSKDAPKPPPDLKEVTAELAKVGVEDLRLVSQSIINTTANAEFQMSGTARLDTSVSLRISGMVRDRPGEVPDLQIMIDATQVGVGASAPPRLCHLDTTINAPPGHSVVLGVTPSGNLNSVFVVQVLRQ
jgi:hypothetical protein